MNRRFSQLSRTLLFCCFAFFSFSSLCCADPSSGTSGDSDADAIYGKDSLPGTIGLHLGVNQPSTNGTLAALAVGISASGRVLPHLSVGVFAGYSGERTTPTFLTLPDGTQMSLIHLLAQLHFNVGGLHAGIEGGAALRSWGGAVSTLNGGTSSTSVVYGPQGGYDFRISKNFSIGAELHYLIATANPEVNRLLAFVNLKVHL